MAHKKVNALYHQASHIILVVYRKNILQHVVNLVCARLHRLVGLPYLASHPFTNRCNRLS